MHVEDEERTRAVALVDRCPQCGARALVMDIETGEIVCTKCGAVVRERVEAEDGGEKEWREDEGHVDHRGPPQTALYPIRHETVIGPGRGDFARLREVDSQGDRDYRAHIAAASTVSTIAGALSLPPPAQEEAMRTFMRAHEAGAMRGRSMQGIAAAAVLYTCRRLGIPRRIADVARAAGLGKHELWMHYKVLTLALGDGAGAHPQAEDFVARVASAVVSEIEAGKVARRALELLREVRALDGEMMSGKDPMGLAAAAVYLAALMEGLNITQLAIAQASGVTEVTVRNSMHRIRAVLAGHDGARNPGAPETSSDAKVDPGSPASP
ncbi:TFIIB-type zinc ribbon-containing protein [Conexivisphaera calida]|uniref:Transcription initiation factor IIB n=1 Tax=Conexivisphaera calida TaxID=1874277 RepID=A0A4P2VNE0_9ARCH|nr:transcription initiation factor IIB family protein [Conexivisphaera calida]BBE42468.1 Transcription initiation factor B [Conexivisphaera calida]